MLHPVPNHPILFTGGGTLGPVTPLLAVAEAWRRREGDVAFAWIGTHHGPERLLVERAKIPFTALAAPKLDRTRPWTLPFAPLFFGISLIKSIMLLRSMQPRAVISAGAYVSVPLAWAAWGMRIPVYIHQLDVEPGMANRLMAWCAKRITVTWPQSASVFPAKKTLVVGAMTRAVMRLGEASLAKDRYGFPPSKPLILVIGGGTGAASMNESIRTLVPELVKHASVIHLTGRGKMPANLPSHEHYIALEFLDEGLADVYAGADIVIARAGMGTIAELAALGKASILLPIPQSHQVANAHAVSEKEAAEVLIAPTPQVLLQAIMKLLKDQDRRAYLSGNIRGLWPLNADERIVHEVVNDIGAVAADEPSANIS
jgi:UDP-N-acetylglucosamine--N-acetylmuramyl-(pentapeptide) pyrophosphoryl-undecaprenol N-acetylglucosamine transferase